MTMRAQHLAPTSIDIPDFCQREPDKVADDFLLKSIQEAGIQQRLVLLEDGSRTLLVDGLRRLRCAEELGLGRVPVIVHELPRNRELEPYARELRFVLDEHRQDLLPSQRAKFVKTLKDKFEMSNKQIAAFLGIAPDSVTNWLAVLSYIPPVVAAMDQELLSMRAARVFDGMTTEGQEAVWQAHAADLCSPEGGSMHRTLRKRYEPRKRPEWYRQPDQVAERLSRRAGPRQGKPRVTVRAQDKQRLLTSYEGKREELALFLEEEKQLKREIAASVTVIAAILRNEKLRRLIPKDSLSELEAFAERY